MFHTGKMEAERRGKKTTKRVIEHIDVRLRLLKEKQKTREGNALNNFEE